MAEANYRRELCRALWEVNRVGEAIQHGLAAKSYFEAHPGYPELINTLVTLASCYVHTGDSNAAFALLGEAESIARSEDLRAEMAEVLIAYGASYGGLGQPEAALQFSLRAVDDYADVLSPGRLVVAIINVSMAMVELLRFEQAQPYVYRGMNLLVESPNELYYHALLSSQVVIRSQTLTIDEVLPLLEPIESFAVRTNRPYVLAGVYQNIGSVFLNRRMAQESLRFLEFAQQMSRERTLQHVRIKVGKLLARAYAELDRHEEAANQLALVIELMELNARSSLDGQVRSALNHQEAKVERAAKERAQQESLRSAQRLSNTSHEIRTPLNAILGLSWMLLETNLDPGQRQYVRHIQNAGESLLETVSTAFELTARESVNAEDGDATPLTAPLKILVVEDNPINQLVVQNILRKFSADYVANGAEAVAKVKAEDYDLIFMDYQMPIMDGCEATQEIRKMQTDRRTPIVAMTASVMDDDRKACFNAGMDGFLAKPLSKQKMMAAIRQYASVQ